MKFGGTSVATAEHWDTIRARLDRIETHLGTAETAPVRDVAGFNLSDIFEYMSPEEARSNWDLLLRSARPASRLAYRTLFVPRTPPRACRQIRRWSDSRPETTGDRTFFYDRFLALETG